VQLLLSTSKPSVQRKGDKTPLKAPVKPKTINWNQVAKNEGFKDMEEVKEY
jgi:hypothetical protein